MVSNVVTRLVLPDGSYVAQRLDFAIIYAGYLTHWWGPGWISALSLSNNGRPFPQIGIARSDTEASSSWLLIWRGPWQAEFIAGWFDDRRVATNTFWDGLRVTLNPLPGLEIGFARTDELCDKGHPLESYSAFAEQFAARHRRPTQFVVTGLPAIAPKGRIPESGVG